MGSDVQLMICPECMGSMQQLDYLSDWRKCGSCGYCHDKDGYNKLNPRPEEPEPKVDWDNQE